MTAEILREAAALMRTRAGDAGYCEMGYRWAADVRDDGRAWVGGGPDPHALSMHGFPDAAEHIASWHPVVALAVSHWLDAVAIVLAANEDELLVDYDGDPIAIEDTLDVGSALAVATAYLGADS